MLFVNLLAAFHRSLLTSIEQLKEQMKEVQSMQLRMSSKIDHLMRYTGATQGTVELPPEIKFPLSSMEELDLFQQHIQDIQLKNQVVSLYVLFQNFFN
jgi:hypothetical protein